MRLIARGGMADVWEAKDTLLERQVAVKILHPHLAADAAFVARFRTEAIAAARLHHRSIVAIFDTCSDNGVEAIVMELARGHTLREEIDRHGALDPVVVDQHRRRRRRRPAVRAHRRPHPPRCEARQHPAVR